LPVVQSQTVKALSCYPDCEGPLWVMSWRAPVASHSDQHCTLKWWISPQLHILIFLSCLCYWDPFA